MSSAQILPEIRRSELIERLEQATTERLCVLTPNQRLAGALAEEFAWRQAERGRHAWEAPDILPLTAFIDRLYQDALYSELGGQLPLLLTPLQEQAIWENVITGSEAGSGLLSAPSAASLARDAWQLAHAWQLLPSLRDFFGNDDTRVFADWAWRYEGMTARDRQTDRARLPELVSAHARHAALRLPKSVVAYGFDILTPQQQSFLAALGEAGVALWRGSADGRSGTVARLACTQAQDENEAAARWARARLEAARAAGRERCRIGVVVPDLARSQDALRRAFTQVMAPAHGLAGEGAAGLPFNISLGKPLAEFPLVRGALFILDLAVGEVDFASVSRLILSPFLAGAESEAPQRAALDAALRRASAPRLTLERLRRLVARLTASDNPYRVAACPRLQHTLGALAEFGREHLSGARLPGVWARAMLGLLDACGFPGERTLDSTEYQTLQKLHEAITSFAALDRVAGRMRFIPARARLARALGEVLFQPEAAAVPVHILGVLEAAGMQFDHLWVMRLSEDAWPMPPRPNPLVPIALQKRAGVSEASAAASLELDRRLTRGWMVAAGEVVFSHPLREDDRDLPVSPLIRELPEIMLEQLGVPAYAGARDALRKNVVLERIEDGSGPPLAGAGVVAGGTSVYRDQAACPFRAFAMHRLGARGLDTSSALNASDRGTLVHALLAKIWRELKSSSALEALSERDLRVLVNAAADAAVNGLRWQRPDALGGRLAQLEQARLARLALEWLELEKQRPPFEIAAIEAKQAITVAGLTVNARLDRMDRLLEGTEGAWAVIDYKTGRADAGAWLGERPDEPQLPLYAVGAARSTGAPEGVVALAFAQVRSGAMEFRGLSARADMIPGVLTVEKHRSQAARAYANWEAVLDGLRRELDALAREFVRGEARVSPKHGAASCRLCELHGLCRISEREGRSPQDDDEAPADFGESA